MTPRKKDAAGRFIRESATTGDSPSKAAPMRVAGPDGGLDPVGINQIVTSVEVRLKRDYWRGEDDRVAAGTIITVARSRARELLANDVIEPPGF